MINPFWVSFRLAGKSGVRVAKDAGMSRATFYNTIDEKGIPGRARYDTMCRIAESLGQRVVITLEPLDNGGEAK